MVFQQISAIFDDCMLSGLQGRPYQEEVGTAAEQEVARGPELGGGPEPEAGERAGDRRAADQDGPERGRPPEAVGDVWVSELPGNSKGRRSTKLPFNSSNAGPLCDS